jgi:hypothetical protein
LGRGERFTDRLAMSGIVDQFVVKVGCRFDNILRAREIERAIGFVDTFDQARRHHPLLPEDPEPGIDDETTRTVVERSVVDLPMCPSEASTRYPTRSAGTPDPLPVGISLKRLQIQISLITSP